MKKITRTDLKAIRTDLTSDEVSAILDLHHDVVKEFEGEIQEYKTNYVAKSELETLNKKIETLEKTQPSTEEKTELENLRKFKTDIEAKTIKESKINAIKTALAKEKANPKMVNLLLKEFDLDSVELAKDGEVKDIDTLLEPLKTSYADCFGIEEQEGTKAGKGFNNEPKESNVTTLADALAFDSKNKK